MLIFVISIAFIVRVFSSCKYIFAREDDFNFTAVVSYSLWDYLELDQLYDRMQSKRDSHARVTNVMLKECICRHLIGSRYFSMREHDPVDINEKLYKELKRNYPKILENLYEDWPQMPKFVNRTQKIVVNVKSEFARCISEDAFVCVARNRQTGKLLEYYVSETYNLNEASNWADEYTAARFVFVPHQGAFSIRALAEQPASAFTLYVENFYLRTRRRFVPAAENVEDDKLCRLTKLEKVRVCSSVLNTSHFHHKIRYSPNSDFIFDCQKMEVSFRTDDAKTEAGETYYEEWMLWCLADPIETDAQTEYFVSRAYHPNHVFVYARDYSIREMYVENLSAGIGVVVD